MDEWKIFALIAYAALNLVVFLLFATDKCKARFDCWRVSERTLHISAWFGILGAWMGILICRHKTQKSEFLFPMAIISILNPLWVLIYAVAAL